MYIHTYTHGTTQCQWKNRSNPLACMLARRVVMSYNVPNIVSFTLALNIDIIVFIFMTQLDLTCSE
jgi:hypothetical protein